jgi:hypothetical protein
MIGIINGIKSIENKLDNARAQYIESNTNEGDDYLQITEVLSNAFNNASEEITQDIISYKKYNNEEMIFS